MHVKYEDSRRAGGSGQGTGAGHQASTVSVQTTGEG